jgi:hypothetical protein
MLGVSMEVKLSVSIGATIQDPKGNWIKPEVGAEVVLTEENAQETFAKMWDEIVGPQFRNVVQELIASAPEESESEESSESEDEVVEAEVVDEKPNVDEDDYY